MLHHAAMNNELPQYDSIASVHRNRWGRGPEYHFIVERNGVIRDGRPIDEIGWHAGEANTHSIGICLAGDFRYQQPTKEQIASLSTLLSELMYKYGIPWQRVFLHREVRPTECPVVDLRKYVQAYLKEREAKPLNYTESRVRAITRGIERAAKRGLQNAVDMLQRSLERLRNRVD